jgi:phage terminase large subunit-like protein
LDGVFGEAVAGALFDDAMIDAYRVTDGVLPDMVRIVVAIDPSGSGDVDNADNDEIGIAAVGLGTDGVAYVMQDNTLKAGPATWGKVAVNTYERLEADCIVGETNFGGDMVRHVIHTEASRVVFRKVTASRGKVVRAEPFSALYEQGKVRHVGRFNELEDELCGFTTNGYVGGKSPNRADAVIWGLAELFPAIVRPRKENTSYTIPSTATAFSRRA